MNADLQQLFEAPALASDPRPGTRPLSNTALDALGIDLLVVDTDRVVARMLPPASHDRGALLVLAETVASTAAGFAVGAQRRAFGAELGGSFVDVVQDGAVLATATPIHTGMDRHTWEITMVRDDSTLVFVGRCTLGIVDQPTP